MSEPSLRARPDDLSWRSIDGEVVLLDERDWQYLHLNGSAAELWLTLAEGTTREALVAQLVTTFSIDETLAARDVDAFLVDLEQRGLLAPVASTLDPASAGDLTV